MNDFSHLLSSLPINEIAAQLGESPEAVQQAANAAIPALLLGMDANAADPAGEASLLNALGQHNPALVEGGINLNDVDPTDGEKITQHIFGQNQDQVIEQLGGVAGDKTLVQKLLPYLAPIVMAWLAKKVMGIDNAQGTTTQAPQTQQTQTSSTGGGILGSILGQILGGGAAQQTQQTSTPSTVDPQFTNNDVDNGTLQMPTTSEEDVNSSQEQSQSPSLGGGILGQILGGLLGGGTK